MYSSKGEEGLRSFYECVKTSTMPAGEGIGDSNELLEFLCDKVPFLDKLMRFKVAHHIQCNHCEYKDIRNDSIIEFDIAPSRPKMAVTEAIAEAVKPFTVEGWKCEKCSKYGCTKQLLISSFPDVLNIHLTTPDTSVTYPSQVSLNGITYALLSIVCYRPGHWYTFGRDMPPGQPWYSFDDTTVRSYDPKHFPLVDTMRLLMYYRIKE